jgi:hypothetical protein
MTMAFTCQKCGHRFVIPLPVEPLYDMQSAALLIPTSRPALVKWLSRNKDKVGPPLYRTWNRQRIRLLRASDIIAIREATVSPERYPERYLRRVLNAPPARLLGEDQ